MNDNKIKKLVAVLTGGGSAAGQDPFIVSFTGKMKALGYQVLGIECGWKGLMSQPSRYKILNEENLEGLVGSGGTSLGTSRVNPYKDKDGSGEKLVIDNLEAMGVTGLMAFGGDDTLGAAYKLSQAGVKVIGIPKTMDLDLNGTDYSVGFWSYNESVFRNVIPGFIEVLKSHRRIGVIELFGRHSGFTSVVAGITGGACYIAVPEVEINLSELKQRVLEFHQKNGWGLVVVSEAVNLSAVDQVELDEFDNEVLKQKRTAYFLAKKITEMTGLEARDFQCSHPLRGVPSSYDSFIGFRLGIYAAEMVLNNQFGKMLSIKGDEITTAPLDSFKPRKVITEGTYWYDLVKMRNAGVI